MCRGFNFPLEYSGEIAGVLAGVLAGFYRDIVQCIRRGSNFLLEPRFVCVCWGGGGPISSLKPLGQLKPNFMLNRHEIEEESLFKWSRRGSRSFSVLHYCQTPGAGAFSRDFTINLSPQCRAFSRALKTEKLNVTPGLQMNGALPHRVQGWTLTGAQSPEETRFLAGLPHLKI